MKASSGYLNQPSRESLKASKLVKSSVSSPSLNADNAVDGLLFHNLGSESYDEILNIVEIVDKDSKIE